ncbi:antiviral reverse transcriptase Drt3b [Janthinobacterium sp. SUN098]|uniref:antiviral reverse transcriptase Drt3b n=1 Tax=Janthinobacterium sp. SUN098 TaxID=3002437 RepID=UPI0038D43AF9
MNKNIKKILFKKSDYNRILLTEVLPYELPIFFSNDSFYSRIADGTYAKLDKEIQRCFFQIKAYTLPYNYEVIKSDTSARLLSIMHPAIQLRYVPIYEKYDSLILHLCARSSFSIRKPVRVAKHYFEKNVGRRFKSRHADVELAGDGFERQPTTASSYFAYGDYNMAYRFFDSKRFHDLEKRYRHFRSLDVSKCFYHIYTHTISWAVKSKEFAKSNGNASAFENDLDKIMQHSNYNETNGIIVGPETSRIFAEIIFQKIDLDLEKELEKNGKVHGKDYQICRYVDDYYLFSNDKDFLGDIERSLSIFLAKYKLYFNENKTRNLTRPFSNKQTLAKVEAARIIDRLFDGLTEQVEQENCYEDAPAPPPVSTTASTPGAFTLTVMAPGTTAVSATAEGTEPVGKGAKDGKILFPKYLKYPDSVAANYIRDLKLIVTTHDTTFDYVSSYFHSGLIRRLRVLLARIDVKNLKPSKSEKLWKFISQLTNIFLFVFAMSPRVRSTYQLSEFVLLIKSTVDDMPRDNAENTKKYIFDEIFTIIESLLIPGQPQIVEISNLLVIMDSLGSDYKISEASLLNIFDIKINDGKIIEGDRRKDKLSYFEIVSILRYMGNSSNFLESKKALANYILDGLSNFKSKTYSPFCQKAENILLVFDVIRCPFYDAATRLAFAKSVVEMNHSTDLALRAKAFFEAVQEGDWFYRWDGMIDLRTVLQKKELRSAY